MSRSTLVGVLLLTIGAAAQQPAPPIQNGRVETRQTTAIDREITALTGMASAEPLWAGWRVPIADGQRGGCCTYSDETSMVRGCFVANTELGTSRDGARPAPVATPATLDAGTGLVKIGRAHV